MAWFDQAAEYWKQAITLTPENYIEARQCDRGIVYPIADTSGDFKRLYDRNFAEKRPETIH